MVLALVVLMVTPLRDVHNKRSIAIELCVSVCTFSYFYAVIQAEPVREEMTNKRAYLYGPDVMKVGFQAVRLSVPPHLISLLE